ncbi:MAG: pentapeptide repeat-containing protein [Candidatus Aenigmarchaeota archaeon]|nr:pentapeptide repeat-containing protein [Candidatus Aenigmarchaeota archaeon]
MSILAANDLLAAYRAGRRDFTGVKLHGANFVGLQLQGIILKNADLSFSNFEGTDLSGADFSSAILARCNFHNAIMKEARFDAADLSYANIRNTFIDGTSFRNAKMMWAHLCGNDLMKADISSAQLDWSCLIDTKMTGDQVAVVPKTSVVTLNPAEHEQKLLYAQPQRQSSVYETKTATETIMTGYTMPQPKKGGDKKMYC